MIKEVHGDILLSSAQAIAHGIAPNDHFDNDLALALRERWPAMAKDFRHHVRGGGDHQRIAVGRGASDGLDADQRAVLDNHALGKGAAHRLRNQSCRQIGAAADTGGVDANRLLGVGLRRCRGGNDEQRHCQKRGGALAKSLNGHGFYVK